MAFRAQPYDVGAAYGRLGGAVQEVAEAPLRALEIIDNLKTRKINRELTEEQLKQYRDEIEQGKLSKEAKDQTLMEFIDAYEGKYDEIEGPPTRETSALKSKMSEKQFFDTVTALASAIDSKDDAKFGRIMNNVTSLIQRDMPNPRDYGGAIALNEWSAGDLDKEGFVDKISEMNTNQINTFFNDGLPGILKEYEATLKGKSPTEEGAISFMLKNKKYENIPKGQMVSSDKWKKTIKDLYPSEKEVSTAQARQTTAQTKEQAAKTKGETDAIKYLDGLAKTADANEAKATSLAKKAAYRADKLAAQQVSQGTMMNVPAAKNALNSIMENKKQSDDIQSQASAQLIMEETGGNYTEEAYDGVINENGGSLPGVKNYEQWLTLIDKNRPEPEVKGFGERLKDVGTAVKEVVSPTKTFKETAPTRSNLVKKKARDKKTGDIIWVMVNPDTNEIVERLGKVQ